MPSFFSLPFSSHLRTLVPLSFQAKLGQEIGTLPIPQIHSCSCSTGGESQACHFRRGTSLGATAFCQQGAGCLHPIEEHAQIFPGHVVSKICQRSLLSWQSTCGKLIERPRAKERELGNSVAAGDCQSLARQKTHGQQGQAADSGSSYPLNEEHPIRSKLGMKNITRAQGLLDNIQKPVSS